jgi:peroxiredoxin
LSEFGVTTKLASALSLILPIVELLTAVILIPVATARYGAVVALALLVLFIVGVVYNLAIGRKPACNCFGQFSAEPIGPFTVLRNLLLVACALVVVVKGSGIGLFEWVSPIAHPPGFTDVLILVGLLFIVFQCLVTLQVLRQQGRMLQRLDAIGPSHTVDPTAAATAGPALTTTGLGIGAHAPDFSLISMNNDVVTLNSLLASGDRLLLLFMNPHCGPCLALAPDVAGWMHLRPAGLNVFAISEGTAAENREKSEGLLPANVLLQKEREVADAYHAWGTPAAVVIAPNGQIVSGVAQGADSIRALIAEFAPVSSGPPARWHSHPVNSLGVAHSLPKTSL